MNHIHVESNAVETETTELQDSAELAIIELNAAQLVLIGGGTAGIVLD
jgi:hypothetical protein